MRDPDQVALSRWFTHRDANAFREIVQRHAAMVFSTCERILQSEYEAEDVALECFEALLQSSGQDKQIYLGPWLHGVAANKCLMRIRSAGRRRLSETVFAAALSTKTDSQWRDVFALLDEILVELPDEVRSPIAAHFICGKSHGQIARETGVPKRTVASRIQRGLELMTETLRRRGVTVSATTLTTALTAGLVEASAPPVTLAVSLDKLAIAHGGRARAASTTTAFSRLLTNKMAMGVAVFVLVAVICGVWLSIPSVEAPSANLESALATETARPQDSTRTNDRSASGRSVNAQIVASDAGHATVSGTVKLFGTNEPVSGVEIGAYNTDKKVVEIRAVSDKNGRYMLSGLSPGVRYTLPADGEATGEKAVEIASVTLAKGESKNAVDIVVARNAISGRVIDKTITHHPAQLATVQRDANASEQAFAQTVMDAVMSVADKPLAGVKIILGEELNQGMGRELQEVVTDAEGRYVFRGVPPRGTFALRAETPDGAIRLDDQHRDRFRIVGVEPKKQESNIDFSFRFDGISVTGTVTNSSGGRITGAQVSVLPQENASPSGEYESTHDRPRVVTASSGDDGRYRLANLCPADIREAGAFMARGQLPGGGTTYAVRASAEGYAAAQIVIPGITQNLARHAASWLDEAQKLKERIGAADDGGAVGTSAFPLPASQENEIQKVDFALEQGATVSGRVVDMQGKALPKSRLRMTFVSPPDTKSSLLTQQKVAPDWLTTDESGRFTFQNVPASEYLFQVRKDQTERQARNAPLDVSVGRVLTAIDVVVESYEERGSLSGRILDAVSRRPVEKPLITFTQRDSSEESDSVSGHTTLNEAGGSYQITGVSPGAGVLVVAAPGFATEEVEVEVRAGQTREININLTPEGVLQGYATRDGKPCGYGYVSARLSDRESAGATSFDVQTNEEGYYEITGLRAGEYRVRVSIWLREDSLHSAQATDYALAKIEPGKATQLDVEFAGTAVIRGEFVGPDEDGLSWQVRVFDGSAPLPSMQDTAAIDNERLRASAWKIEKSGQYEIGSVPPGAYTVVGMYSRQENDHAVPLKVQSQLVTVGEEETVEADFDLR